MICTTSWIGSHQNYDKAQFILNQNNIKFKLNNSELLANYEVKIATLSASPNFLQILAFCSSDMSSASTTTSSNWEKEFY